MDRQRTLVLLLLGIAVVREQIKAADNLVVESVADSDDESASFTLTDGMRVRIQDGRINLKIHNKLGATQTGFLGHDKDTTGQQLCQTSQPDPGNSLCLQWDKGPKLEIYRSTTHTLKNVSDFQCTTINWTITPEMGHVTDTPEDCYTMDLFFWFGGFEAINQTWPMNKFQIGSSPFVTGDAFHQLHYGGVIEGIFISSSGVGIFVHETTPLYLSINDAGSNKLCLKGKVGPDTPFFQVNQPFLIYDICQASDIVTLWKNMAASYIPKPLSYPSPDVIRKPIWCTWAPYHADINQNIIMEFAAGIKKSITSASPNWKLMTTGLHITETLFLIQTHSRLQRK